MNKWVAATLKALFILFLGFAFQLFIGDMQFIWFFIILFALLAFLLQLRKTGFEEWLRENNE